jgi:hypothetical protein
LKAQAFHDTITQCEWLKRRNLSPGGWAVDYGVLYTLFRVLNEYRPTNVLEFGLGESSKLIHQYASFFDNVQALTVEHDTKWKEFFMNSVKDFYDVNVKIVAIEESLYKGYKTIRYKDVKDELPLVQYDLILVDGPFGSDHYSRIQILDIIPSHLGSRFCIIFDDYNRKGEKETVRELLKKMQENNIKFKTAVFYGMKEHFLICSEDVGFLTTLS